MSDPPEHPDAPGADAGRRPSGPVPRAAGSALGRNRRWLVPAVAGVAVLVAAVLWSTRGSDDASPDATPASAPTVSIEDPETVLDEVFPGRPDEVVDRPTPDPAGAADAQASLQIAEAAWVRSAFDDLDFVVVLHNVADVAFGNVRVDAIFVDAAGTELAREPFSYPLVGAGGDLVISGLRPIDPDAVAEIRVETSARGSLPDPGEVLQARDVSWDQDDAGTVTVTGAVVATTPTEFVSVVGVLRGDDGEFLGTAFAFVDAVTDEPRQFEAVGFPVGDVGDVDIHLTG